MHETLGAAIGFDATSLRANLVGRVVSPEDPDYDALRTVMSGPSMSGRWRSCGSRTPTM